MPPTATARAAEHAASPRPVRHPRVPRAILDCVKLSTTIDDPAAVPHCLWDEPLTMTELRARLATDDADERARLAGKVLREAPYADALALVPVAQVVADYDRLRPHLGRRRAFWDYLLAEWRALGLLT